MLHLLVMMGHWSIPWKGGRLAVQLAEGGLGVRGAGIDPEGVLVGRLQTQELKPTSDEWDMPRSGLTCRYSNLHPGARVVFSRCRSDHSTLVPPVLISPLFLGQRPQSYTTSCDLSLTLHLSPLNPWAERQCYKGCWADWWLSGQSEAGSVPQH